MLLKIFNENILKESCVKFKGQIASPINQAGKYKDHAKDGNLSDIIKEIAGEKI